MKDFLKMTLAVLLALVLVSVLSIFITAGLVGSMAESGKTIKKIPSSAVLKIDLSGTVIAEQEKAPNLQAMARNNQLEYVGLWNTVCAINAAAEDPAIKYIYLKSDGNATSAAKLQELRRSLEKFRQSGKPVISYIEAPTTGSYYISSVADKVFMTSHPGTLMLVSGVSLQMTFFKDLLDRLGINMQLIRHGKYKSAGETFICNAPSKENLEQYQAVADGTWKALCAEIAASRGISEEKLNSMIDNLELCLSSDFLEAGLVDELVTREQLKAKLAEYAMEEKFSKVRMVSLSDYIAVKLPHNLRAGKQIAVIYADGDIVDGKEDLENIAGDRFASIISKVRADSTVKAVVLRVNSPGGSCIASEKIKAELDLLKQEKPLVASYGNYAASGGYWISGNCDKIFSDAVTLTGSIGVFGMVPDVSKAMKEKAHINVVSVNSNKHGDMYSGMRPLSKEEYDYQLRSIEDIYGRFVGLVAEGRSLDRDYVDEIGQGRVWIGSDALERGLVDEIGTLEDAISWAAVAAGDPDVKAWKIQGYPKPLTTMEMIMASFGEKGLLEDDEVFAFGPVAPVAKVLNTWYGNIRKGSHDYVFARMPFVMEVR